jgi:hypothetical protein
MIGKLLGAAVRIVTLPVDIVEITLDMATGGSGSKASRKSSDMPMLSNLRDKVAETLEEIDE